MTMAGNARSAQFPNVRINTIENGTPTTVKSKNHQTPQNIFIPYLDLAGLL
jgi:hypothetical protein